MDKLDIDKLETVPIDLNKLSDVVKILLLKQVCMMNLLKKLNTIDLNKENLEQKLKMLIDKFLIHVNLLRSKTLMNTQR